jgi:hypothetical protein
MPIPAQSTIYNARKQALLSAGYVKRIIQNGQMVTVPGELPDQMDKLIQSTASGDNAFWSVWQISQTVVGQDMVTGAPVVCGPAISVPGQGMI